MRQILKTKNTEVTPKISTLKPIIDKFETLKPPNHKIIERIEACREILNRVKNKDGESLIENIPQKESLLPNQPPEIFDIEKCRKTYNLEDLDVIRTIGAGTFGRVILVQDSKSNEFGALKIITMAAVIQLKQVQHVKNEKNILKQTQHPFIVNLKWDYKDDCNLYMLFDFIPGGELFSYLRTVGYFTSKTSSFYAAEIVCALEYLHNQNIVYRDLKPENLLLDREGHVKMTDFGFAKQLVDRTWTLCGTPEYIAPEVIQSKGHGKSVDWWALGILIYEMLLGHPPFFDDHAFSTYEKILAGRIEWSKVIDQAGKDIVKKLLVTDRTKRLGNMKGGVEDIKKHRWFKDYDWDDVLNRRILPPILPRVSFDGDSRNFDNYPEIEDWNTQSVSKEELELFHDF